MNSKCSTLGQKSSIYAKIHILKISFFTKFTFSKSHFFHKIHILKISIFSQNSHFRSLIFHKVHIFKVSLSTKFTFFKHQILGTCWIKSWFLPHCGILFSPPPDYQFLRADKEWWFCWRQNLFGLQYPIRTLHCGGWQVYCPIIIFIWEDQNKKSEPPTHWSFMTNKV